mmetsp:Transcript_76275/g.218579  ORF Transcript_76275/g.218579 Transcript_76275/m.218579 type:complete len:248 (-) Transcript_76275:378-1121(-)
MFIKYGVTCSRSSTSTVDECDSSPCASSARSRRAAKAARCSSGLCADGGPERCRSSRRDIASSWASWLLLLAPPGRIAKAAEATWACSRATSSLSGARASACAGIAWGCVRNCCTLRAKRRVRAASSEVSFARSVTSRQVRELPTRASFRARVSFDVWNSTSSSWALRATEGLLLESSRTARCRGAKGWLQTVPCSHQAPGLPRSGACWAPTRSKRRRYQLEPAALLVLVPLPALPPKSPRRCKRKM